MYQIVVCDDEQRILDDISQKVKEQFNKENISVECISMNDSRLLIEHIENAHIDVLFLDIDMPYFSGMDIAGFINKNRLSTLIVFVTSHDALVYQTFEYRPFSFVRKSYIDEELEPLIKRIALELKERKEELVVSRGQEILRIPIKGIVFVEASGNYLNIRTDKEEYKIRETMTSIEKELKCKGFIRCHKGYLVNCDYIVKVASGQLEVEYKGYVNVIPIGRSYEKDVKRSILEMLRN